MYRNVKVQIGQIASSLNNRNQGELPNKMEVNPKEHVKAVTLRSGKQLKDPPVSEGTIIDVKNGKLKFQVSEEEKCEETNLVLNWEKCYSMVKEGIVLGHKIFSKGIEVDKAKIEVIEQLPPPSNVKGIRSFLGHASFYRRFIKDFSKIAKPLCDLLCKDTPSQFNDNCLVAFERLK
ncbi:uncharacterized protein LOC113750559 [Coffea eugenioides]|uniref:uncharacterized protein LOC113750559 n=1 Tax=Coffea eugenioides TaxID=49369 RepID=UPI000F60D8DD|nr:uncharacterized protein LOC113750559 [Coffea eugenioides]